MFRTVLKQSSLRCNKNLLTDPVRTVSVAANTETTKAKPFSEIPKIPTVPLIGSGWVYLPLVGKYDFRKFHEACLLKFQEYGPIVRESFNRDLEVVHLFDPEDIAKIYRKEGKYPERIPTNSFRKYRSDKRHLYNNGGVLTTQGSEWWEVRSQTQPHLMKPKAIHAYLSPMDQVASQFTDRMVYLRDRDGGEVPNYLEELFKWSLESIGLVSLDARLGCIDKIPNQEAENIIQAVNNVLALVLKLELGYNVLWKKFTSFTYKKFEKNMDYFSQQAFKRICEAKIRIENAPEDHEPTLLELLLSTTKEPRDVNAVLTDLMFAGIDTTSSTVGFTLYHLARNPEAQEKAYQEIKATVKGSPLIPEHLNNLRYLKACVKEGMRINPVSIGNVRKLAEPAVLQGYEVPAGTYALAEQYAIGQMEKYFPEPKKFRPERFLRNQAEHDPFAFLPFGFGPRSCLGLRIANQEILTLLIRVIERFRIEYNFEEIGMQVKGVALPDKPLRFQFYDR